MDGHVEVVTAQNDLYAVWVRGSRTLYIELHACDCGGAVANITHRFGDATLTSKQGVRG
jgi:NCAIR mutase (PurE)-related protein